MNSWGESACVGYNTARKCIVNSRLTCNNKAPDEFDFNGLFVYHIIIYSTPTILLRP